MRHTGDELLYPGRPAANSRADLALVDGDPAVRHALSFAFDTAGLRVAAFADAESALGACGREDWRCLIMDERLPGMPGLTLLTALRGQGFDAPAILITTNPTPDLCRRAQAAGVEIIEKPLLDDALAVRVRALTALQL